MIAWRDIFVLKQEEADGTLDAFGLATSHESFTFNDAHGYCETHGTLTDRVPFLIYIEPMAN